MEHSLSSVTARYDWALGRAERRLCRTPRIRPPRGWTARSGMHAALACASAKRGKSCSRTQSGRLHSVPDCARGSPVPCTRRAAERHASTRAQAWVSWTDTPWLELIADRAYDVDAFRAWQASQGMEAVRSAPGLTARNGIRPTQLNVTGTDRGWPCTSSASLLALERGRGHGLQESVIRSQRPFPGLCNPGHAVPLGMHISYDLEHRRIPKETGH